MSITQRLKKHSVKPEDQATIDLASGISRAFAQGATFGFADEAEAFLRSVFSDRGYKEIRDEIRGKIDQFREEEPYAAYGTELVSGMMASLIPVAGQVGRGAQATKAVSAALPTTGVAGKAVQAGKKTADILLNTPVKRSVAGGAVYGTGAAEEMSDVPQEALLGGAIGGTVGKLVPQVGKTARQLGEKVDLSVGQKFGGILGGTEEMLTGFGIAGKYLGQESPTFRQSFTIDSLQTAAEEMGMKLPKATAKDEDSVVEAYSSLKNMFDKQYDDVLSNIDVPIATINTVALKGYNEILDGLSDTAQQRFKKEAEKILKSTKGKDLSSGEYVKSLQSQFNDRASSLTKQSETGMQDAGSALFDLKAVLMKSLEGFEGVNVERLKDVNKAYRAMLPVQKAIEKAGAEKIISPKMLDDEIRKQSLSTSKYISDQASVHQARLKQLQKVKPRLDDAIPQLLGTAAMTTAGGIAGAGDIIAAAAPTIAVAGAPILGMSRQLGIRPFVKKAMELPSATPAPIGGLMADPASQAIDRNFGLLGQ